MSPDAEDHKPTPNSSVVRRQSALGEASRLIALAEHHLTAAKISGINFLDLRNSIAAAEKATFGAGSHQIEGRRRYPAKKGRSRRSSVGTNQYLFIDESGSWQLASKSTSDDWFAVGAVAMSAAAAAQYVQAAEDLKMMFFGDPTITFHEPAMRRGEMKFDFGESRAKQEQFRNAVDLLVWDTEFVAFGIGIRKRELGDSALGLSLESHLLQDPYALALHLLLERYVDYLAHHPYRPRATIVMESQQSHLDALHQLTVAETIAYGTQYVAPKGFEKFLNPGVRFEGKQGSHPLELSDMLARDVFEWIRSDCSTDPARWPLFLEKFYARGDLRRGKFGLKVFPDSNVAEQVEKSRMQVTH